MKFKFLWIASFVFSLSALAAPREYVCSVIMPMPQPTIDEVRISLHGETADLVIPSGRLVAEPVRRAALRAGESERILNAFAPFAEMPGLPEEGSTLIARALAEIGKSVSVDAAYIGARCEDNCTELFEHRREDGSVGIITATFIFGLPGVCESAP